MKLAVTLVHNKTPQENEAQITALKNLMTEVTDGPFTNRNTGETWTTVHHELIGLSLPHEVRVYQVVPFGGTAPVNIYDINSGGIVYYGKGDEDKTGNHPRFFNWGTKRGIDNGADISIYLEDVSKLNIQKLQGQLQAIENKPDLVEDLFGKLVSVKTLIKKGQLDESKDIATAFLEYRGRVQNG